jgi:transcription initiation factor IIE alpha subunit
MAKKTAKSNGAPAALRTVCSQLSTVSQSINAAMKAVVESGIADAEKVVTSLEKADKRVTSVVKRINPDAAVEREKERKRKRIDALTKQIEEIRAEIGD